ncbi:unnamed protein product [Tilletia controversa]|uniref:Uncharacterized protein n=1 Tax=Tilletia controversa TaxID=13291 RepID=A0A8X7SXW7_9BASI|nr:hypothetical protein CF328_g2569 [Tilletia controversa]KAE8248826.1 hypothetical protein A4X06_0g3508 [Tilletia controversa]CAD6910629.1 unnamed protein product [Tilletia controversa]
MLLSLLRGPGAVLALTTPTSVLAPEAVLLRSRKRRRGPSSSSHYSTAPPTKTTLVDPTTYTTNLLQQSDRSSYLISHFFPQQHHRRPYLALRALNVELAQIRDSVSNEILGRIRVGWWRDAVRALYASVEHSRAQGAQGAQGKLRKVPPHPVVQALHAALLDPVLQATPTSGLLYSEHHLQSLISAREDDLSSPSGPPTLAAVELYAERTASRLGYLELDLLGVRDPQMDEVSSHIGKARGLANLLASIPFHARMRSTPTAPTTGGGGRKAQQQQQRRLTIPQEYLLSRDVVEEEVYRLRADAPGLRDAIFDTATRANDYLISARTSLQRAQFPGGQGKVPKVVYPALVGAVPAQEYLHRLEKVNFDVFEPGLQTAGWRLSWALWRASRTGSF